MAVCDLHPLISRVMGILLLLLTANNITVFIVWGLIINLVQRDALNLIKSSSTFIASVYHSFHYPIMRAFCSLKGLTAPFIMRPHYALHPSVCLSVCLFVQCQPSSRKQNTVQRSNFGERSPTWGATGRTSFRSQGQSSKVTGSKIWKGFLAHIHAKMHRFT